MSKLGEELGAKEKPGLIEEKDTWGVGTVVYSP